MATDPLNVKNARRQFKLLLTWFRETSDSPKWIEADRKLTKISQKNLKKWVSDMNVGGKKVKKHA